MTAVELSETTLATAVDSEAQPTPERVKLGWKGAVKALAADGALGTTKRWSAIVDLAAATADLDRYDAGLRKHTFSATIGKAKRQEAAPAPCPVHAYNARLSTLRSNMATFGKAPLAEPPRTAGPSVHAYSAPRTTLRSTVATFGKAPTDAPPRMAGPPVHTYSGPLQSFTPKAVATFSKASTGRGEPPKTACSVHSYTSTTPTPSVARRAAVSAVSTFGSAPARPASFVAMTKSGLMVATPKKPGALPPLGAKQRLAATAHAATFASKLRKSVSAVDVLVVKQPPADAPLDLKPRAATAELSRGVSTPGAVTPPLFDEEAVQPKAAPIFEFRPEALALLKQEKTDGYHSPAKRKLSMRVEPLPTVEA